MTFPLFSDRVRAERERLGLSQYDVADRLGVARGTYAQLETRRSADPRLSTLVALVGAGFRLGALAPELSAPETARPH
jgi:transcriptional regulator with XRE-family HTH domain